jgi:hypothetical protein
VHPLALAQALLLAAALPAAADEGGLRAGDGAGPVTAEAALRLRVTALGNLPTTDIRYDPALGTFRLDRYLATDGSETSGSTLAAVRLSGRHLGGALRWTLAADTGELRRVTEPALAEVCSVPLFSSPTGLGPCTGAGQEGFLLPTTLDGDRALLANGRPFREEVRATLLVREASVAVSLGRAGFAALRAGRGRYAIGDGLVHDDYGTGVDAALDLSALGPPFEVRLAAFQPTRDFPGGVDGISPVALVSAAWLPSLFEHVGLFGAVRRDRTGSVAELFRGAFVEDAVVRLGGALQGTAEYAGAARSLGRILTSAATAEATLAWGGTTGSVAPFRGQRISWTAAVMTGAIDLLRADPTGAPLPEIGLSGRALHLRWEASAGDRVSVTPWFLYLSGDRPPTEKARLGLPAGYAGFLGIAPYVTATNLFFGGGLSESFAARQASAPGVNGRGVIAPGLTVEADLPGGLAAAARGAWLLAEDRGPYGGRVYGTEVDLSATWAIRDWLTVGAEADALFPGDFFLGRDTVFKAVVALDLLTP